MELSNADFLCKIVNQWPFASCSRCFSNLWRDFTYVDEARAFSPAMPACHALPPAPAYHASRHAPFFCPPVRHDTSRPIITSPPYPAPQVAPAKCKKIWSVSPSAGSRVVLALLCPHDAAADVYRPAPHT